VVIVCLRLAGDLLCESLSIPETHAFELAGDRKKGGPSHIFRIIRVLSREFAANSDPRLSA
jgi:hypothetical protein